MSAPPAQRTAWFVCATSAALFGAATPAAKLILDRIPPAILAGLLYLGAAVVAVPVVASQRWVRPSRRDTAKVAGAVVIGGAIAPVLLQWTRPDTGIDRVVVAEHGLVATAHLLA
ncbi:MAG: EamA family transporter [Acidimicrobiales bacterium]